MLTSKELAEVLSLSLSSPGLEDTVKINLRASRKIILLLVKAIDVGLAAKESPEASGWFSHAGEQHTEGIKSISSDILNNAGLAEWYQKLNSLQIKS